MNLGNWLTPASQAVGGYLQGQQQKQQADQQAALQAYAIQRQQEQDTLRQQMEQRQQSQLEQQAAIKNRLQGVIPSATPIVPDTRIMGAPAGPGESISRDESLGRMETPSDPNAFQTKIPLPDPGNIHQAILDKGRKPSGVPGLDINFDDSEKAYDRRAVNTEKTQHDQALMDRLTQNQDAIEARRKNTNSDILTRQEDFYDYRQENPPPAKTVSGGGGGRAPSGKVDHTRQTWVANRVAKLTTPPAHARGWVAPQLNDARKQAEAEYDGTSYTPPGGAGNINLGGSPTAPPKAGGQKRALELKALKTPKETARKILIQERFDPDNLQ